MKSLLFITCASALLVACSSSNPEITSDNGVNDEQLSVIQPIKNVDSQLETFLVNAEKGDTIRLSNGGSIVFEENMFVDKSGDPVSGEVKINWEEFHSLADIMLSGIPMTYDSAGVAYDFNSGGMFTISGEHNGEEVDFAQGKKAQVNLVSLQDTPCYNFYELDTETGDWEYETTENGELVEEASEEVETAKPKRKEKLLEVELMTDNLPELQGKDIVGWKTMRPLTKEEEEALRFEVLRSKLSNTGTDGQYLAEIQTKQKMVKVEVAPYLMSDAVADTRGNDQTINEATDALIKYAADVASGKIIRSIDIDGFGTYNWDIMNKRENSQRMIAKFEYPKEVDTRMVSLFLVSPDENIIVKYNAGEEHKFAFDPDKRNCLIGILPSNEVVSFSDSDFNRVRKSKPGTGFTFKLKSSGIKLKSSQDISNYIEELI